MLGVRARWHAGGRESAERAFSGFRSVICEAIRAEGGLVSRGAIEADSAAMICPSLKSAVRIGGKAFHIAFRGAKILSDERLWLRGVIIPFNDNEQLRTEKPLAEDLAQIKVSGYSPSLLEAISAEKAGFKGMRLLIGGGISYSQSHRAYKLMIEGRRITPILRLHTPAFTGRLKDAYRDILWMASSSKDTREELQQHMFNRLRWAASNEDELIHAAITQVVFNHCEAFLASQMATMKNNESFEPTA